MNDQIKHIAIFASGSGTNAEAIIKYFQHHPQARVTLVISNNKSAGVLDRAGSLGVATRVFNRSKLYETPEVDHTLEEHKIDFIVLAGFMLLFPDRIIKQYKKCIVNIHPALLPKYGGKGMYGMRVHEAVIANGEEETGITIHRVNEKYDEGAILFQARCKVEPDDTPDTVAERIHQLEHKHYPLVIEQLIRAL